MTEMQITAIPVPEVLRCDVAYVRNIRYEGDALAIHTAPSAAPGIVFHHVEGRPALETLSTPVGRFDTPTLFLHGGSIVPSVMQYAAGSYTTTQIVLKPHALASLFGMNATALNDCIPTLDEVAPHDLKARLLDASDGERARILTEFLIGRLKRDAPRDRVVEESLRLIHTNVTTITIRGLLEQMSISERQFERRFMQVVGVAPQSYIRVKRFNEAIRLLMCGEYARLTDIAHALNYYDQSHFIRDIKAFSGMTPKDLPRQPGAAHDDHTGYSWSEG